MGKEVQKMTFKDEIRISEDNNVNSYRNGKTGTIVEIGTDSRGNLRYKIDFGKRCGKYNFQFSFTEKIEPIFKSWKKRYTN